MMSPKYKTVQTPYGTGKIHIKSLPVNGKQVVKMDKENCSVTIARGDSILIEENKIKVTGFIYED